jgi:hypothetical protein
VGFESHLAQPDTKWQCGFRRPRVRLELDGASDHGVSEAQNGVELYWEKPEIKVLSINQIKVVDSHPVR